MLMNDCWSLVPGVAYWRPDELACAADGEALAALGADECVGCALGVAAGCAGRVVVGLDGAVGAAVACAGAAPGMEIAPPPAVGSLVGALAVGSPPVGALAAAERERPGIVAAALVLADALAWPDPTAWLGPTWPSKSPAARTPGIAALTATPACVPLAVAPACVSPAPAPVCVPPALAAACVPLACVPPDVGVWSAPWSARWPAPNWVTAPVAGMPGISATAGSCAVGAVFPEPDFPEPDFPEPV
jgi:hypothetical protein